MIPAFTIPSYCDEPRRLEKIVVTPSRLVSDSAETGRSINILDSPAIALSSYNAIPDIIGNIGGIDIRRRGPEGVQSDVNIRGATFEENTVLIDGIRINDPQTGHYTMDLPVTLADVDRIEILKGPASSVYGPNSFGGVINIITKKPEGPKISLDASGGSFDYFNTLLSAAFPIGILGNRFTIEESRSTGYMPETEFNILSLSDSGVIKTDFGDYNFLFGYTKKDFGADTFYVPTYSNEEEHTDTRFFKIDGVIEKGGLKMTPKLFLRRHWDKFIIDRNQPGGMTNYHTNYSYGVELDFVLNNNFMDAAYGFEVSRDTIDSTNIQTHSRTNDDMFFELSPHLLEKLAVNLGMRWDHSSGFNWAISPSASAVYELFKNFSVRGLVGRSYRIPTFTDLYYNDVKNAGNPDLRPESSWTYEAGADFKLDTAYCSATYFHRNSYDTIDWTRPNANSKWQASNIGTIATNGVELSLGISPKTCWRESPVEKIFFEYTACDSYRKHDYLSKYALDYLKQQISFGIEYDIVGFKNSWVLNFKKRVGQAPCIVADFKLSKNIINKGKLNLTAFFEATNLFDTDYSEQSDVSMPGRWFKSGGRIEF
ncbi:MAG: TonB-dependent receptor [Candidatus Omnitrophica bacterium]|nr:TonB-dependent receptor [Candidatus Omnitrophota bacterium]